MTAQDPDRIRYKRRVYDLFSEPMDDYFDDDHPKPSISLRVVLPVGVDIWLAGVSGETRFILSGLSLGLELFRSATSQEKKLNSI